jgi:hypothetical protein
MEPHLRLHPGQQELTPAQEAEARRFALERITAHLTPLSIDEPAAEGWLRRAYQVASLAPPQRIHWVDGPLGLLYVLAVDTSVEARMRARLRTRVRESVGIGTGNARKASLGANVLDKMWKTVRIRVQESLNATVGTSVQNNVWSTIEISVDNSVRDSVGDRVEASVNDWVWESVRRIGTDESTWECLQSGVEASVRAYRMASWLARFHFFGTYLAPNEALELVRFNEMVSGYWLGQEGALIVRRPRVLSLDAQGYLHHETGKCLEYPDGWGFYAWHGVRVPERVILAPETLTREDFLNEPNVEARRVLQERMGQRFVPDMGGVVVDAGPRGTLYEVVLPRDLERVARYVQVRDTSTSRQYFLRVPPTVQTAAEAVAWSFDLSAEDYGPAHET